jgi:site-specific DNA-methyltransferase (adenine-specific)
MGISLRLAGFEVRDSLQWLYGSGFPKSHSASLAIDKALGREKDRQVTYQRAAQGTARKVKGTNSARNKGYLSGSEEFEETTISYTRAASEEAAKWEGWGTALKPAHEPILLVRRPLEGTIANNLLKWGAGAINVDGCRIPTDDPLSNHGRKTDSPIYGAMGALPPQVSSGMELGRWPANVLLDQRAGEMLDEQAPKTGQIASVTEKSGERVGYNWRETEERTRSKRDALGGASRFFYCPKASVREKEAGLEPAEGARRGNTHPTVKPLDLMRYLVRLITPPEETVLDPFAGSGSTLIAAGLEGRDFVGIELDPDHVRIAQARLAHWLEETPAQGRDNTKSAPVTGGQMELNL